MVLYYFPYQMTDVDMQPLDFNSAPANKLPIADGNPIDYYCKVNIKSRSKMVDFWLEIARLLIFTLQYAGGTHGMQTVGPLYRHIEWVNW